MKALVVFHGDCDGVISAGIYIRRFLLDYYPNNIVLRYTQPWRISIDFPHALSSINDRIDCIAILDLAINEDLINVVRMAVEEKGIRNVIVIDHHASSAKYVSKLREIPNVKVYWEQVPSTPQVLVKLIKRLNSYEQFLVNVADVCEGVETNDHCIQEVANIIKLSLALDPTDSTVFYSTVNNIVRNVEFWTMEEYIKRYNRAKWLMEILIRNIDRRSIEVNGWRIAVFTSAESIIYAGLFGVAASEYVKRFRRPIVIVRDEGRKIVVTVRSAEGRALDLCRCIASEIENTSYGGHKEAASATIFSSIPLEKVVDVVSKAIQKLGRCR